MNILTKKSDIMKTISEIVYQDKFNTSTLNDLKVEDSDMIENIIEYYDIYKLTIPQIAKLMDIISFLDIDNQIKYKSYIDNIQFLDYEIFDVTQLIEIDDDYMIKRSDEIKRYNQNILDNKEYNFKLKILKDYIEQETINYKL